MARYTAITQCFLGDAFVLSSSYEPFVQRTRKVDRDASFMSSSLEADERATRQPSPDRRERNRSVGPARMTTLAGRSPHERKY